MSIKDLTDHLLRDYNFENKTKRVLQKEMRIRKAINHENEASTLFDFLLYYIKIWKLKTQYFIQTIGGPLYCFVYDFICDVEANAYDLTKSLLIDAENHEFNNSIIVISIISVSIDILLMTELNKSKFINAPLFPETLKLL